MDGSYDVVKTSENGAKIIKEQENKKTNNSSAKTSMSTKINRI